MDIKAFLKETKGLIVYEPEEYPNKESFDPSRLYSQILEDFFTYYNQTGHLVMPKLLLTDYTFFNQKFGSWFVMHDNQPYIIIATTSPVVLIESIFEFLDNEWITTAFVHGVKIFDDNERFDKEAMMVKFENKLREFIIRYTICHELAHYSFSSDSFPSIVNFIPEFTGTPVRTINRAMNDIWDPDHSDFHTLLEDESTREELTCDLIAMTLLNRSYFLWGDAVNPLLVTYDTLLLNMAMLLQIHRSYPTNELIQSINLQKKFKRHKDEWQIRNVHMSYINAILFEAAIFTISKYKHEEINESFCNYVFDGYEYFFESTFKLLFYSYPYYQLTVIGKCMDSSFYRGFFSTTNLVEKMGKILDDTPTKDKTYTSVEEIMAFVTNNLVDRHEQKEGFINLYNAILVHDDPEYYEFFEMFGA